MDKPEFVDPSAPAAVLVERVDIHKQAYEFEPLWQGNPLEAFTLGRQSLAEELATYRMPLGKAGAANEAYMPNVWAVLWLCTHTPQEWRVLRTQPLIWWEQIEAWAEEHCPRSLWLEAINLVHGRDAEPAYEEDILDDAGTPTGEKRQIPEVPGIMGMWEAARKNIVAVRRKPGQGGSGNG